MILCISTATNLCSVAIGPAQASPLGIKELADPHAHSTALASMVEQLMHELGIGMEQLSAVAINKGPGSYTGLRIGTSLAKGICYALGKPLLALGCLEIMAHGALQHHGQTWANWPTQPLLCPMVDARRMEIYTALFDTQLQPIAPTMAKVVDANAFAEELERSPVVFFGDGAAKCREVLQHPNARFVEGIEPSAQHMLALAHAALASEQTEDVAYFEPFYLKDFVAIKAKNKVLSGA